MYCWKSPVRGAYRPLWSSEILAELDRTLSMLIGKRGVTQDETDAYLTRLLRQMETAFPEGRWHLRSHGRAGLSWQAQPQDWPAQARRPSTTAQAAMPSAITPSRARRWPGRRPSRPGPRQGVTARPSEPWDGAVTVAGDRG